MFTVCSPHVGEVEVGKVEVGEVEVGEVEVGKVEVGEVEEIALPLAAVGMCCADWAE